MEFQAGKEKKEKNQRGDNLEIGLKGRVIILNKEKKRLGKKKLIKKKQKKKSKAEGNAKRVKNRKRKKNRLK